jgi:hypothetical protein
MTKSFLTATAFAALIGFAASGAMAQQSAPSLDAPAIQKSAPVESGKSAAPSTVQKAPGTVQNKSGTTMKQGATAPVDGKSKRDAAAVKPADSKAKSEAAQACATIKDKAAQDACLNAQAKNQPAKTPAAGQVDQKAATPEKTKPAPRVGG